MDRRIFDGVSSSCLVWSGRRSARADRRRLPTGPTLFEHVFAVLVPGRLLRTENLEDTEHTGSSSNPANQSRRVHGQDMSSLMAGGSGRKKTSTVPVIGIFVAVPAPQPLIGCWTCSWRSPTLLALRSWYLQSRTLHLRRLAIG